MNRPVANINTMKRDVMRLVLDDKEFIPSSEELSGNARNPELKKPGQSWHMFECIIYTKLYIKGESASPKDKGYNSYYICRNSKCDSSHSWTKQLIFPHESYGTTPSDDST